MKKSVLSFLSYVLVAVCASVITMACFAGKGTPAAAPADSVLDNAKLADLEQLLDERFIGEVDDEVMVDAVAAAMVDSLGDRWSHYMTAEDYTQYKSSMANSYVGIGITISTADVTEGFSILKVEQNGPAWEAGIRPGDMVVGVEGQSVVELGVTEAKNRIQGKEGTQVKVTIRRDGQDMELLVWRRSIQMIVAKGQMLENNIGLVTIENFHSGCAKESIAAVESLLQEGATALIFDVRNNPGGYKKELVDLLDYLLPEGVLFRSEDYAGRVSQDKSDAKCLEIPMAVLVNGDSYSAAEFFAAALSEYDAAVVVGQQTCGKGYFQNTLALRDGSAVTLSVGKYTTPNGVNLANVGITPDVVVEVDEEVYAAIYGELLAAEEDPQIQAAAAALQADN